MKPLVEIKNLTMNFRRYNNPNPALKETVVELFAKRNKTERVNEFKALDGLSLNINEGERVGVIGLNGAGKSTLLNTVARIYTPQSGTVVVRGRVTPILSVGTGFDVELSGRENIRLNALMLGYMPDEIDAREEEVIKFSGLRAFIDTPIKYYSSGMHAKLAFSTATMIEPEVFLVDEVFAAGDAKFVGKATEKMKSLFDTAKVVMFVSHSIEQVIELCNRAIVIHEGKLQFDGSPGEAAKFYVDNIVKDQKQSPMEPLSLSSKTETDLNGFVDLVGIDHTKKYIRDMSNLGFYNGLGNVFNPFQPLSRAEFFAWCFFAHNLLQTDQEKLIPLAGHLEPQFSDVPREHSLFEYIQALVAFGYDIGYGDETFRPEEWITREECIAIKVALDFGRQMNPDRRSMEVFWSFKDSESIDDRLTGYIYHDGKIESDTGSNINRAFGITKEGTFRPKQAVLRHEAVACLWSFGIAPEISGTTAGIALEFLSSERKISELVY